MSQNGPLSFRAVKTLEWSPISVRAVKLLIVGINNKTLQKSLKMYDVF